MRNKKLAQLEGWPTWAGQLFSLSTLWFAQPGQLGQGGTVRACASAVDSDKGVKLFSLNEKWALQTQMFPQRKLKQAGQPHSQSSLMQAQSCPKYTTMTICRVEGQVKKYRGDGAERGYVMRFWALRKGWVVQFLATLRGWVTLFYYIARH